MKMFIKFYRENPAEFCEEFLGIKLLGYQKKVLKRYMEEGEKY